MIAIDRKAFLLLAATIAAAAVACSDGESDGTGSGAGAIEGAGSSGTSGNSGTSGATPAPKADKPGGTGEFDRDGAARLFVAAAEQGSIKFSLHAAGISGVGAVTLKEAFFVPGNRFRWSPAQEGNCGLDFVPTAHGYDVSEFVTSDGACDLRGEQASLDGHYVKSSAAPRAGHFMSPDDAGGEGTLDVTAVSSASVSFSITVVNSSGKSGSIAGQATKTTDPSVFTFKKDSCALTLDFGGQGVVVEATGCERQANGTVLARGYAVPNFGE